MPKGKSCPVKPQLSSEACLFYQGMQYLCWQLEAVLWVGGPEEGRGDSGGEGSNAGGILPPATHRAGHHCGQRLDVAVDALAVSNVLQHHLHTPAQPLQAVTKMFATCWGGEGGARVGGVACCCAKSTVARSDAPLTMHMTACAGEKTEMHVHIAQ